MSHLTRVSIWAILRRQIKAGRKRGAAWVRLVDVLRHGATAEGRGRLLTSAIYRHQVHQTTPYTAEERYPELFDFTVQVAPNARRILSFGCSTGEELSALRVRFPEADIVGAEINPRSRRIARRRMAMDARTSVIRPQSLDGRFELIFALAVLQREPHEVEEIEVQDLSSRYSFERFDAAVRQLVGLLDPKGVLVVFHSQYRVEDSTAFAELDPLDQSPGALGPFFGRDGTRLNGATARTAFRKRPRG